MRSSTDYTDRLILSYRSSQIFLPKLPQRSPASAPRDLVKDHFLRDGHSTGQGNRDGGNHYRLRLGAGFSLASHDMDIRGAGNIVGEEQSGHIREVGVELYQHLLQEAIIMARAEQADQVAF